MLHSLDPSRRYNFNEVAEAVVIKKKRKDGHLYAEINFEGTTPRKYHQGGKTRIAEVAFLNEYGVPTHYYQKPRPFIKQACATGLFNSMETMKDIILDWLMNGFNK